MGLCYTIPLWLIKYQRGVTKLRGWYIMFGSCIRPPRLAGRITEQIHLFPTDNIRFTTDCKHPTPRVLSITSKATHNGNDNAWRAPLQYRPVNKKLIFGVSLRLLFVAQGQVTSHITFLIHRRRWNVFCYYGIFLFMPNIRKGWPLPRILDDSEWWEWHTKTATCNHQQQTTRYY